MNKRHYEHTLPNIRGSLSNTYIFSLFLIFCFFNADSRVEGVEFQTILSASRLSDIFFMRLSVASVVFVSGA